NKGMSSTQRASLFQFHALVLQRYIFQDGVIAQSFEPFFTAKSTFLIAAKWHLNPAACTVIIDEHLACTNFAGYTMGPRSIFCPNSCYQSIVCAISKINRLLLCIK